MPKGKFSKPQYSIHETKSTDFCFKRNAEVNAMDDGGNSRTTEGLLMAAVTMPIAVI